MAVVKEFTTRVLKDPLAHREYWPWAEKYYMTRKGRHLYYEAVRILKAAKINPAELGPRPPD